ncbi:MAG: hypothetical protein ACREQW_09880 [Candidatus Binatia bacterium]
MATVEQELEQRIERLASEIGQVVRSADPEKQDQLKDLATTLVSQEVAPIGGGSEQAAGRAVARSMNPLAAGLGLLLLAIGFFFLLPPVGVMLGIAGLIGIVWGSVISWTKN